MSKDFDETATDWPQFARDIRRYQDGDLTALDSHLMRLPYNRPLIYDGMIAEGLLHPHLQPADEVWLADPFAVVSRDFVPEEIDRGTGRRRRRPPR